MAFRQGIDFRATAAFVTDPTDCTSEIGTTANYPRSTPQGNTVGWEDALGANTRDRNSGVDARLAGIAFCAANVTRRYRIDLPAAGWYRITIALGDNSSLQSGTTCVVLDGTTIVSNVVSVQTTANAGKFFDACGVLRSSASDWVSNEVSFVAFFSTTTCRIRIGGAGLSSQNTAISHIFVQDAPGAPTPSFDAGINLRQTYGFVTDPAGTNPDCGLSAGQADYPHITAQGFTVGWEQAPGGFRDRSAAVDARLAGVHFLANTGTAKYRIDLPAAGKWLIDLAAGDASSPQTQTVELFDGTTSLGQVVNAAATATGQFYDATGTLRTSAADWAANKAQISETFATTILRVQLGGAGSGNSTLAHIALSQGVKFGGVGALTAALRLLRRFAATVAGVGTLVGSAPAFRRFSGTLSGVGHLTASIPALRRFTAAISGRGTFSATLAGGGGVVRSITAGITGQGSLRAQTAFIAGRAAFVVAANPPVYYPYQVLRAGISLVAKPPRIAGPYTVEPAVLKLAANPPLLGGRYILDGSGAFRLAARAPRLAGAFQPSAAKVVVKANPPTYIPYQATVGSITLQARQPIYSPRIVRAARFGLAARPPIHYPYQVSRARIVLAALPPTYFQGEYILESSGILRLAAKPPTYPNLREPPPPPPPTAGEGISTAAVIG